MSLSVYEERLVYDYIRHILKSALDFFTESCAHFGQSRGHTVKKFLQLPKKVRFSSQLVQLFEYFVEEESFSDLDDTIPITDEERKGFYKVEETDVQLISKHPPSIDLVMVDTSEPNSSNRSNVVTELKETQMDIQLEPYNTFVDAITKRTRDMSQDTVKGILSSPDSKKTKTDLLLDDESDDDEIVMQSTPEHEEDCGVNGINMVSDTSQSSIRSKVASLFLKLYQNYHDESEKESVCLQSTTHDAMSSVSCNKSGSIAAVPQMTVQSHVYNKEYTTEVNKGTVWESTPNNAELKNIKKYTYDDSLNQIVPKSCGVSINSIIADEKRHHENVVNNKPLSTAIILAQEITQNNAEKEHGPILIKNETTTHDFKDKASYETFLHGPKPTKHPTLVLDSCTKCKENPRSRISTLEEIGTLLMPIGDEPKPHPFDTRPSIVLNPELLCESNLTACYKPESLRNTSSETTTDKLPPTSPVCSRENYVDFKFSKAAFEDSSESVEDTIKNVDTLRDRSAATTPISSYFDSEQSMSLSTAVQVPVQPVDDMLSELMASQAVRSFNEPSSTTFNNFVRPISAQKRKLIFERIHNAFAVPDIDELPWYDREETYLEIMNDVIKEETTSEDVKMAVDENDSIRDDDKYTTKIYKPTTPSKERPAPSFSWDPLKKNDDSVVPFSHEPFINIHNEFLTPQKVRLGLSKKIKARNRLHPYKK